MEHEIVKPLHGGCGKWLFAEGERLWDGEGAGVWLAGCMEKIEAHGPNIIDFNKGCARAVAR